MLLCRCRRIKSEDVATLRLFYWLDAATVMYLFCSVTKSTPLHQLCVLALLLSLVFNGCVLCVYLHSIIFLIIIKKIQKIVFAPVVSYRIVLFYWNCDTWRQVLLNKANKSPTEQWSHNDGVVVGGTQILVLYSKQKDLFLHQYYTIIHEDVYLTHKDIEETEYSGRNICIKM